MQFDANRAVYSVSDLNRDVKALLGQAFPLMWIQGEISNLAVPSSGHWYFTLKDDKAQVRSAMFKQRNRHLKIRPQNGMQVLVRAKVSLYEPRGDYQLIVEDMEEAGAGMLQRQFELLKEKLNAEGLFSPEHKQTIPTQAQQIGVITSPTGAAIRDILSVLGRRASHIPIVVYPVPVQGEDAAQKIASMINTANQRDECDVLILSRGGGSLEDLWSFNEEIVARAIFASRIPLICGVGHEIDFTIADFVADQRAATPSAAAEIVAPDRQEQLLHLQRLAARLKTATVSRLAAANKELQWRSAGLKHPSQALQEKAQRVDELELRLEQATGRLIHGKHLKLQSISAKVHQHNPRATLTQLQQRHSTAAKALARAWQHFLHDRQNHLAKLAHNLDTVSPLATLTRGYSIISRVDDDKLVREASELETGSRIRARLGKGEITAIIEEIKLE